MPPPIPSPISRKEMPIGTSTWPVLLMLPTSEKILGPLLPPVPVVRYQSEPRFTMKGTLAQVSTLFRFVGLSYSPRSDMCTYLGIGSPGPPPAGRARSGHTAPQHA